ncbi:MAG TPA: TonB-dependent receptor [Puia sp.]|nr:TonB-dependent receptor [Puia sp.]
MRLTCLLLAIGCTGLQLLMAHTGNSQDLTEVRVTLELKNEPLKMAFARIEKQTDFRFAYNRQQIDNYRDITLPRASYTLQKAMELLLTNTRLSFKQVGNKIIVFQADDLTGNPAAGDLTAALTVLADGTVKGRITNDKGEPIVGASVLLVGADKGAAAGIGGEFTLAGVKPGKYKIQVSAIGFQNIVRDITVGDNQVLELNFQLKAGGNALDEVVVTGYSKQSKRDVTGAASTISAEVVAQTPATDVTGVLQGRVAGVSVDGQGGPGSSQVIRIRGIGTLNNNDPLYVIDGVQIRAGTNANKASGSQNISNLLNPNDIESITILKDPSLISLYGAEGSNGVVVITTKTGKLGAPKLEYNGYIGQERPKHLPKMITPQQQADALYNSFANSSPAQTPTYTQLFGNGATPVLPDYIIEAGTANTGVMAGDPAANPSLYNLNNYRILKTNKTGTDWWKEVFKPATTQNHQLTLSGATDKNNYAATFGYLNDNGTLLNSYFQRYSLRVNTQFKVKPWLRVGENVEMSYSSQNSEDRGFNNDIAALYQLSPLMPTHDIAGHLAGTKGAPYLGQVGNVLTSRIYSKNYKGYNQSVIGAAYIEAEPVKGLIYQNQIGFQFIPSEYHYFSDTLPQEPGGATVNAFSEGGGYSTDWRWLNKLSYSTTIHDIHKITAFVAYEARAFAYRNYYGTTGALPYTQESSQYLGQGNPNLYTTLVGGGGDKYTNASFFGNLTYSLLDKYLFTASARWDGSSKFGPNEIYGNFGAVSGGWRISKERFMDPIRWISDLKLRASYGTAGNDAIPSGEYLSTLIVNGFGYYDLGGTNTSSLAGAYPYQIGNSNLHWESNNTTNIGFDASLFQNKLTVSFNWFNKTTKGLIYSPPSPGTAGSALSPYLNIMNFTNKGVELELGYNGNIGKLRYDMGFNIATYRNRVNYIDGIDSDFIAGGYFGSGGGVPLTRSMVGHPVSSFYGYVYDGLFQNAQDVTNHADESLFGITAANGAGHVKYKDLNKDGKIDLRDQAFIGNPNPKFTYGYNLNLYYGNFDLGILVQGVYGNKILNYFHTVTQMPGGAVSGQGGLLQGSLDTWTPSNPNAKLPIYSQDKGINDLSPSSFFIEDGSYLRVKMLQLGYTIPKNRAFNRLRIYVQAYNLFTFTHYSGMDPEVNDGDAHNIGVDYGTAYPISMKLLFGVNLGL